LAFHTKVVMKAVVLRAFRHAEEKPRSSRRPKSCQRTDPSFGGPRGTRAPLTMGNQEIVGLTFNHARACGVLNLELVTWNSELKI